MKTHRFSSLMCATLLISFSSCESELGTTDLTEETSFVEAYVDAESVIIHTLALVDEILRDSIFISTDSTVLYSEIKAVSNNNEMSIFYGFQGGGTTFPDGVLRSGHISVSVSNGNYDDVGSTSPIVFDNFTFKSGSCRGTVTLVNNGGQSNGHEFDYSTSNFEINNNALTLNRTMLFVSDFLPLEKSNRQLTITSNDTTRFYHFEKGVSADVVFVSPLTYEDVCEYSITSGELDVFVDTPLSETTNLSVDFLGENDCANLIRGYSVEKDEFFFIAKRGF